MKTGFARGLSAAGSYSLELSKPFWTWQAFFEDLKEPWISDYLLRYQVDFLKTEERSCHRLEIQRKFVVFCRKMLRVFTLCASALLCVNVDASSSWSCATEVFFKSALFCTFVINTCGTVCEKECRLRKCLWKLACEVPSLFFHPKKSVRASRHQFPFLAFYCLVQDECQTHCSTGHTDHEQTCSFRFLVHVL